MPKKHTKVMITGASGLLGSHIISSLQAKYEIHAIVRSMPTNPFSEVIYHFVDFNSDQVVIPSIESLDTIIHLAQSPHFRDFPQRALDVFQVNIASTARLLDYAQQIGVKRFIYASSGGIYGSNRVAFTENAPIVALGKLNYYLGSKLCGEVLAQSYASLMYVTILRFFFMYGPRQKRSMLMPRLVDNIKYGRPITLQGSEGICINPIHVEDAVAAVNASLHTKESATFNISGPEILSLRRIAELMGQFLKVEPKFEMTDAEPQHLIGDNRAMREKLVAPSRRLQDYLNDIA